MSYEIKELGVGGILDQAIKVFKDGLGVLLPITFCLMVPLQIAFGLTQLALMPVIAADATPEEVFAAQMETGTTFAIVAMVGAIVVMLTQYLTLSALVFAIADLYLGDQPTIGNSFSRGVSRWMPLLGTSILYGLAMMGGFLLFIIPGIFVALWFYLSPTITVLEEKAGSGAMKRSKALMKDNLSKAVAIGFLIVVLSIGISLCANFIPQPHAAVIAQAVLAGVTTILSTAIGVVFYFSCRCQHENFDLNRLAQAVGKDDPGEAAAEPAHGF